MSDSHIIKARNLKKRYAMGSKSVEALRGLDLSVQAGDFIGIMGPSGSGKSTLMHIIGCLEQASEGYYCFDGKDVSCLSDKDLSFLRANKIGSVFQTFNLIPQYSVLENVLMPFLYRRESGRVAKRRAEQAVDRVHLSPRQNHRPSELSGGEMQRVAIARALVVDPLILLADEPTGNLDSETSKSVISLFGELNAQGVTLILVTHEKKIASRCRHLYTLHDGRFVHD